MKHILFICTALFTLTGCTNSNTLSQDNRTNQQVQDSAEAQKTIVASFYPLAFIAEQIVAEKATVINLAGSSDVHDYEPSPQDLVQITTADLVIYQGVQLEPWASDVIPELDTNTLEVSHNLSLSQMEEGNSHDEVDNHDDEEHNEEGYDEHGHGEYDPHTWLDPVLAQQMVAQILAAIIEIDGTNKDFYEANATVLQNRFAQLDQIYTEQLSTCTVKKVIISHDAFGYIARRYNFTIYAIAGVSTQDEPSANILAELKREATNGVTHILVEENNVRRFADTLANETGLTVLPVNPLGKGTLDATKDFFDVMQENLESFTAALNCSV